MVEADGGSAFSLVDEPFEEVPEGGAHLSAEQARGPGAPWTRRVDEPGT